MLNLVCFSSQVHAVDSDAGRNGLVTYRFSPRSQAAFGRLFRVDNNTGVIYTTADLDYELAQVTTAQH